MASFDVLDIHALQTTQLLLFEGFLQRPDDEDMAM
jgi:hypothetical protein